MVQLTSFLIVVQLTPFLIVVPTNCMGVVDEKAKCLSVVLDARSLGPQFS